MLYSESYIKDFIRENIITPNKINSNAKNLSWWKNRNFDSNILKQIFEMTAFLENDSSFSARICCILNDIKTKPICKLCQKPTKWNDISKSFRLYCGVKCSSNDPEVKKKKVATCIKKYGVSHHLKRKDILEKQKRTNTQKYGVENVSSLNSTKEKRKETCLERYGTEYFLECDQAKTNRTSTLIDKYGVDHYSKTDEYKNKVKITCQERYGTNNPSTLAMREHISQDSLLKLNNPDWLREQHHILQKTQYQIGEELGISQTTVGLYFKKFNIEVKLFSHSQAEKQLRDYIEYIYSGEIQANTRKIISPFELDIYIPDKNIAIEYNGTYYHSLYPKNYHLQKTLNCLEKGIQLYHIFDFEWNIPVKQTVWKSILKSKLDVGIQKIFARKCEIKEVESKTSKEFLKANHLQGECGSSIQVGLYYQNELVALMTFGKPRFNKRYEWELIRFCNKLDTRIVGGASKLLKYFESTYKPKSLISYADRRYSNGLLYGNLEFSFSHESLPNYYYYKDGEVYSRIKFQKHKLESLLEIFDPNLTESENMSINNYIQIYDCGNLVYIKSY